MLDAENVARVDSVRRGLLDALLDRFADAEKETLADADREKCEDSDTEAESDACEADDEVDGAGDGLSPDLDGEPLANDAAVGAAEIVSVFVAAAETDDDAVMDVDDVDVGVVLNQSLTLVLGVGCPEGEERADAIGVRDTEVVMLASAVNAGVAEEWPLSDGVAVSVFSLVPRGEEDLREVTLADDDCCAVAIVDIEVLPVPVPPPPDAVEFTEEVDTADGVIALNDAGGVLVGADTDADGDDSDECVSSDDPDVRSVGGADGENWGLSVGFVPRADAETVSDITGDTVALSVGRDCVDTDGKKVDDATADCTLVGVG